MFAEEREFAVTSVRTRIDTYMCFGFISLWDEGLRDWSKVFFSKGFEETERGGTVWVFYKGISGIRTRKKE